MKWEKAVQNHQGIMQKGREGINITSRSGKGEKKNHAPLLAKLGYFGSHKIKIWRKAGEREAKEGRIIPRGKKKKKREMRGRPPRGSSAAARSRRGTR